MTLIKERRATNSNKKLEAAKNDNSREDRVDRPLQINRSRELRYLGPISVIPNTTYIRRLEHKGLLIPESKGCVLPVLTSKTNAKRKKLDLPGVKNRWELTKDFFFFSCNIDISRKEYEKSVQRNSLWNCSV